MSDPVHDHPQQPAQPGDVLAEGEQRPAPEGAPVGGPTRTQSFVRDLLSGSWLVSLLAVVAALVIGGVLIALADPRVQEAAGYLFARPGDFIGAAWDAVYGAYRACLLYTSPSPRDKRQSRMPSSA